jgi:hypothetical protein
MKIAHLERELAAANERANVAEEQLRRVHIAVRAFKQSQTNAKSRRDDLIRAARAQAEKIVREAQQNTAQATTSAGQGSVYGSWLVSDPTLDQRLDDYLRSDFEPDRSRDWMLSE